jgi:hypothetical protein
MPQSAGIDGEELSLACFWWFFQDLAVKFPEKRSPAFSPTMPGSCRVSQKTTTRSRASDCRCGLVNDPDAKLATPVFPAYTDAGTEFLRAHRRLHGNVDRCRCKAAGERGNRANGRKSECVCYFFTTSDSIHIIPSSIVVVG